MTTRVASITKNGHTYAFRYSPTAPQQAIDAFMQLAEDPSACFDWVDAAGLSFKVTHDVAEDCWPAALGNRQ